MTRSLFLQATTSVNYENEKSDDNSHTNSATSAIAKPFWREKNAGSSNGPESQSNRVTTEENLSPSSSLNYYVPSDSDIEDDVPDVQNTACIPSKIPQ